MTPSTEPDPQPRDEEGNLIPTPPESAQDGQDGPVTPETSGDGVEAAGDAVGPLDDAPPSPEVEPFDYDTHAPYLEGGVSPPMPDLSGVTPVEQTPPRDQSPTGAEAMGHAGFAGSPGWDAVADAAGRDPSSEESKQAKGKRPKA